jgi:hypothetical protein
MARLGSCGKKRTGTCRSIFIIDELTWWHD